MAKARARSALLLGAFLGARAANAADPTASDKETSRGLYAEGIRLLEAGDYAGAERACRGAHALVQAPTSSSCWARSLEGIGRLVEAREAFLEAVRYPFAPGEPQVFTSARETARIEADALAARIPSITLVVTGASSDRALVTMDGLSIASDTLGLPRRVDPGPHVIVVHAPGFRPARAETTAGEGQERKVNIALEPGSDDGASLQRPNPSANGPSARTWSYVALGAGAIGLAAGALSGLAAASKESDLTAACKGNVCPASAEGTLSAFHGLKTTSTAFYVLGVAGAVGGLTLWLTSKPTPSAVGLWVGPSSTAVVGAF